MSNLPATTSTAVRLVPGGQLALWGTKLVPTLLRGGFFIAVCTAAFLLVKKGVQAWRRHKLLNQVGENSADGVAIGFASRLYAAMISGHAWWNDWVGDGTDEESCYQVAREMHAQQIPFALVAAKYRILYTRELLSDLTSELNGEEMQKFQAILTSGLGNVPEMLLSHLLVTVRPTTVLDHELRPVQDAPAACRLGEHTDTLILPGNRVRHGFTYNGLSRFVDAADVRLVARP